LRNLKNWFQSPAHNPGRSLAIVRMAAASILIVHPIHAFLHPANIHGFADFLRAHGLPWSLPLAWAALLVQFASSLALLVRRCVVPACLGNILVLAIGIPLVHFPRWRSVGLATGEHHAGAEFSCLLIACLIGVLWAHRKTPFNGLRAQQGLGIVRLAAPLILVIHPLEGLRNPAALNDLGAYFSSIGFPFGVELVWSAMFLQIASSTAVAARRLIVPACLGHMLVLCTGIYLFHAPDWFVVGPGNVIGPSNEGMEYSILLLSCFVSLALAYWPIKKAS
jgi:putative oxidoreductase